MPAGNTLVYLLRRDLRISDNPVFQRLTSAADHGFTHLLPVYVLQPDQIETSGLLKPGQTSPFPPAKSRVGRFWRCGPHRAKFLAESVWDLKSRLEASQSGLVVRVGDVGDVVRDIIQQLKSSSSGPVSAVWMTDDVPAEELRQQKSVASVCAGANVDFTLVPDEKYYIDECVQSGPQLFTLGISASYPLFSRSNS